MAETGKIKPEINGRGLFLPWPFVLASLLALLISLIVPAWIGAVHAMHVSNNVDAIMGSDKTQNEKLVNHGERIAVLEAKR